MNINTVIVPVKAGPTKTTIIPLEVHYSKRTQSNGFYNDLWLKAIKRIEADSRCYVIFVGDMIDADRPSARTVRTAIHAEPDRIPALEEDDIDHQRGLREGIIKDLKRIKDKIIGMIDGDHFRLYANHTTSTWYIANQLGIPNTYLGQRMGYVNMKFKDGSSERAFHILVRHGKGNGNIGADVNKLIKQSEGFLADLFVGGHTHKSWCHCVPHLYAGEHEVREKLIGYARAGSFLRGFMYGKSLYPEIAEYGPLSVGWPEIYLYTKRTTSTGNSLTVVDIKGLS